MRSTLLLWMLLLAGALGARAEEFGSPSYTKIGDSLQIQFEVTIGKRLAEGNYQMSIEPTLKAQEHSLALPKMVVMSKRKELLNRRAKLFQGKSWHADSIVLQHGDRYLYTERVKYENWMHLAYLHMDVIRKGCCKHEQMLSWVNMDSIAKDCPKLPPPVIPVQEEVKQSGRNYAFVAPLSEYEKSRERAGLPVFFPLNQSVIYPDYMENQISLALLDSAVYDINNRMGGTIRKVVIIGFASPEGSVALNTRLGYQRALAVKEYIAKRTGLNSRVFEIQNGVENWVGLRNKVSISDLAEKQEVLDIIDKVPIDKGREEQLKKLNKGKTYSYLLRYFYPELRYAGYIKIFYEE